MRDDDDRVDLAVRNLAPDVPPMSETTFAAGRGRVLAGAASNVAATAGPQPDVAGPHRPVRRWGGAAVAAAAAVTVLTASAVAVLNSGDSGLVPLADAGAVAELTDAAGVTVTVTAADSPVGAGRYRYVKTTESKWFGLVRPGATSANCWYRSERTEETWIPADRDQDWLRRSSRTGPLETKSCTKEEARQAPGYFTETSPWESRAKQGRFTMPQHVSPNLPLPQTPIPTDDTAGRKPVPLDDIDVEMAEVPPKPSIFRPTPEFLAGLPRDPQKLFVFLRDSVCLADACAWHAAQGMLATGQIPGELRAAVYRALTRIPGMTIIGRQANLHGRAGVAFRVITGPGWPRDLIVDPKTGDYIGEWGLEESPAGQLVNSSAVTTGVADAIGVPPGR